jgi:NitT/TauT family transport system ATP-binding protein
MTVMTGSIQFDGVSKTFDNGTLAIEDFSATIDPGELVAVVGPSGCGKSTLLRLAAGLTHPSSGVVRVPASKPGFVFQDANLMPWRSVLRNVEIVAQLDGEPKAVRRERALEVLEAVGLGQFTKSLPGQLSGGMRMRVSIARALASRPEVIFFDEPFGALDEITRLKMQEDLQQIVADGRYVSLFITHSVSEAVYLANRVLVMSARPGRIVGEVRVDAPHPRPSDFRFTSEFSELTEQVSELLAEGSH